MENGWLGSLANTSHDLDRIDCVPKVFVAPLLENRLLPGESGQLLGLLTGLLHGLQPVNGAIAPNLPLLP